MPSFRDLSEKEKARVIRDRHLLSASPTGEVSASAIGELVESGEIEIWKTGEVISPVRAEIGPPRVVDDGAEMAAGHGGAAVLDRGRGRARHRVVLQ
jgi:hypothetical protein